MDVSLYYSPFTCTCIVFDAKYIVQLRNKESDPEKYALKLRVHQEGVRHCQYSTDGTKVLSCASLEVKVSLP